MGLQKMASPANCSDRTKSASELLVSEVFCDDHFEQGRVVMRIVELKPKANSILSVVADDGRLGHFDVTPYLHYEAFQILRHPAEFKKVRHGGYYVEWDCGADLSADTIEARWILQHKQGRPEHGIA